MPINSVLLPLCASVRLLVFASVAISAFYWTWQGHFSLFVWTLGLAFFGMVPLLALMLPSHALLPAMIWAVRGEHRTGFEAIALTSAILSNAGIGVFTTVGFLYVWHLGANYSEWMSAISAFAASVGAQSHMQHKSEPDATGAQLGVTTSAIAAIALAISLLAGATRPLSLAVAVGVFIAGALFQWRFSVANMWANRREIIDSL